MLRSLTMVLFLSFLLYNSFYIIYNPVKLPNPPPFEVCEQAIPLESYTLYPCLKFLDKLFPSFNHLLLSIPPTNINSLAVLKNFLCLALKSFLDLFLDTVYPMPPQKRQFQKKNCSTSNHQINMA